MQESTTYQWILKEGRKEGREEGRLGEAQRFLLRLISKRFQDPDAETIAAIGAIHDIEHLEYLGERLLDPDILDCKAFLGAVELQPATASPTD